MNDVWFGILIGMLGMVALGSIIIAALYDTQGLVFNHRHQVTLGWPIREDIQYAHCEHFKCDSWVRVKIA